MKLYRSIMAKYGDGVNVNDVFNVYAMASAYERVRSSARANPPAPA